MPSRTDRSARIARIGIVLLVVAVALLGAWRAGLFALGDRAALAAAIERARAVRYVGPLFVITYAIAAAVGVPATPFTLAGGALFGIPLGIALNWLGEMMAAVLAFATTRATGLRRKTSEVEGNPAMLSLTKSHGLATLFRLRLVPVAPFALLNAGAALSGMSWRNFIIATAFGIIPITIVYTISASKLVAGVEGSGRQPLVTAVVAGAALIALSFLPKLLPKKRTI
jgi:uncharacterized membrane protein YdjX (TVP38/TMEM64 family)